MSESAAVSAMHPERSIAMPSRAANANAETLFREDDIARLRRYLLPVAEDVGDHEVRAGHRLTEAETADVHVAVRALAADADCCGQCGVSSVSDISLFQL